VPSAAGRHARQRDFDLEDHAVKGATFRPQERCQRRAVPLGRGSQEESGGGYASWLPLLIVGAVVTFASIETGTPAVLFVATAVAGLGFGSAFVGAYRATIARAGSDERAGLITVIYIVSYLATGIPAVIGGIATSHFGLHKTALVYSLVVAVLAAAAGSLLIGQMTRGSARRLTDHPDAPPGPGTVPLCPRLGQAST
jgi:MFS family permease